MTGGDGGGRAFELMDGKMNDTIQREYRIIPRPSHPLVRLESRRLIERYGHDLVLLFTASGVPELFADWWFDLRRGQLRVWGGLLRFIDLSIASGRVPKAVLKMLPGFLDEYIEQGYDDHQPAASATMRKAA